MVSASVGIQLESASLVGDAAPVALKTRLAAAVVEVRCTSGFRNNTRKAAQFPQRDRGRTVAHESQLAKSNSAYIVDGVTVSRPTLGTQLRHLLELLDSAVEQAYGDAGLDYRPRYTPVVRVLCELGPVSIRTIADRARITHSAASQTVAQMVERGLVRLAAGSDGRERVVSLTSQAEAIVPALEHHWAATNAAAAALDAELSSPLSTVVAEAIAALERQPFAARIAHHARSSSTARRRAPPKPPRK